MLPTLMFALAVSAYAQPIRPVEGARCEGSRDVYALGTGNFPVDNNKATSIVNIWAVRRGWEPPLGWILKNHSGRYYFQANTKGQKSELKKAFSPAELRRLIGDATAEYLPLPKPMASLNAYDVNFERAGAKRYACFSGDYRF